jgi:hypothetical protein
MPWWVWLLVVWAVLAAAAGLLLGAVAARARARERAARAHAYDSARTDVPPGGRRAS